MSISTREEALSRCLEFENVYADQPFDDPNWTVVRHRENKKIFAFIFERRGHIWINLKGLPAELDFFRQVYSSVLPAYHMNKEHWNSVILDGSVPDGEICRMLEESYFLTQKGGKRK